MPSENRCFSGILISYEYMNKGNSSHDTGSFSIHSPRTKAKCKQRAMPGFPYFSDI